MCIVQFYYLVLKKLWFMKLSKIFAQGLPYIKHRVCVELPSLRSFLKRRERERTSNFVFLWKSPSKLVYSRNQAGTDFIYLFFLIYFSIFHLFWLVRLLQGGLLQHTKTIQANPDYWANDSIVPREVLLSGVQCEINVHIFTDSASIVRRACSYFPEAATHQLTFLTNFNALS